MQNNLTATWCLTAPKDRRSEAFIFTYSTEGVQASGRDWAWLSGRDLQNWNCALKWQLLARGDKGLAPCAGIVAELVRDLSEANQKLLNKLKEQTQATEQAKAELACIRMPRGGKKRQGRGERFTCQAEASKYKLEERDAEAKVANLRAYEVSEAYRVGNLAEYRTANCEKEAALEAKESMKKLLSMQEVSFHEEVKRMEATGFSISPSQAPGTMLKASAATAQKSFHEEVKRIRAQEKTTELRALQREIEASGAQMRTELQSFRQLDRDAAVLRSDKARLLEANQRRRNEHQALRAEHEDHLRLLKEELAEKDKRLRGMEEAQESRIATMARIEESVQEMEHHTVDLLATKIKLEEEVQTSREDQERLAELQDLQLTFDLNVLASSVRPFVHSEKGSGDPEPPRFAGDSGADQNRTSAAAVGHVAAEPFQSYPDHKPPPDRIRSRPNFAGAPVPTEVPSEEVVQPEFELERLRKELETVRATASAETLAAARKELLKERQRWDAERAELQRSLEEAERKSDSRNVEGAAQLDLLSAGQWLAQLLEPQAESRKSPEVLLDLAGAWTPLAHELPRRQRGCVHSLHFGMFFGDDRQTPLKLSSARLCPEALSWAPSSTEAFAAGSGIDRPALQADLCRAHERFLADVFLPWAKAQETSESRGVAWLLCNDGEAFTLGQAMLAFGKAPGSDERWRSRVLVVDRAKSNESEPAVEALALAEGARRMVFDMLLKFYNSKDIRLEEIAYVAIDEADFLLTQGFDDLYKILDLVDQDSRHKRQMRYSLITASITKPLWKIFQEDPRFRTLKILESRSLHRPQANCSHTMVLTKGRCKVRMLVQLVQRDLGEESLRRGMKPRQTMVFCNTLSSCKSGAYWGLGLGLRVRGCPGHRV
ncbi:unnamed protein product [Symbiodinium sp. CCMP2592]|nr:unnamed protein product [Symbiodinium sp. CCMP2592]